VEEVSLEPRMKQLRSGGVENDELAYSKRGESERD